METLKYDADKYELIKSEDGFMLFDIDADDYVYDSNGNNLWDTIEETLNTLNK
jgi:hypothetical protein